MKLKMRTELSLLDEAQLADLLKKALSNNAVDPAYQGRGIGSALHREVLRRIVEAGMEVIMVQTLENLAAARKMYEKHGFREASRSLIYLMGADEARI